MGERRNHSESYAGFSFRNVSGTEGWGGADTEISEWHKVFSPSLKKHFYSSYCVFCYLGTDSLQHTPKISKEIKQPMFARNCSVGFFFFFTETDCFEVTAFNLWNSPNSQRSTWLILHPSVKQTDLGSYLASFFGSVFTAGAFARTLIWRQYSVSHCLFSFPS